MAVRTRTELLRATARTIRSQRIRRGYTARELGQLSGVSRAQITQYECAMNVPTLPVAMRLAEALGSQDIVNISREANQRACKRCGTTIQRAAGRPGLYCSASCQRLYLLAHPREKVYRMNDQLSEDLRVYRAAVEEMCRVCPDGQDGGCRVADCPLRLVSPLPLVGD